MDEHDLKRCDGLMSQRDLGLGSAGARLNVCQALADEVPGLVAEVRRLNLQVDALRKLHADDLKWAIERNARLIVALQQIYKLEGPGLDGSSENGSWRIARLALEAERVTEKPVEGPSMTDSASNACPVPNCSQHPGEAEKRVDVTGLPTMNFHPMTCGKCGRIIRTDLCTECTDQMCRCSCHLHASGGAACGCCAYPGTRTA